jgi:hypothetical protein
MMSDTVAQIRITGNEETVMAIVANLNNVEFDALAFAVQAPRKGRKGEHLAYGTVTFDQFGGYRCKNCAYHPARTAVGIRGGVMLCEECIAVDDLHDWD